MCLWHFYYVNLYFSKNIGVFLKKVKKAGYISYCIRIKNCITQILFIHLFNIYESLLGYAGRLFVLLY